MTNLFTKKELKKYKGRDITKLGRKKYGVQQRKLKRDLKKQKEDFRKGKISLSKLKEKQKKSLARSRKKIRSIAFSSVRKRR